MSISAEYIITDSARKHGLSDEDILHAVNHKIDWVSPTGYPNKTIYIGYDTALRDLEGITVDETAGMKKIIHAMKLRKSTLVLIEEYKNEQR